jgi:hypothetical protein
MLSKIFLNKICIIQQNTMNSTLKNIKPKIKNFIVGSFYSGFIIGCIPNKLVINYEDKKYNFFQIPLLTGFICSSAFIISPLLLVNYFFNFTYLDKFIDKYDIELKRIHQYDGNNNKYAYPSNLKINIKSKNYV